MSIFKTEENVYVAVGEGPIRMIIVESDNRREAFQSFLEIYKSQVEKS